jgi:hypothetical protein
MSGIFSRKIYDDCYQPNLINKATAPGLYKVDLNQIQNSSCIASNGMSNLRGMWYGPNESTYVTSLSDIESHLKNLDLPDSRCIEGRTVSEKNAFANYLSKEIRTSNAMCSRNLEPTNTRLEASVLDAKMAPQTRFDFPIRDPRSSVFFGVPGSEQVGSNRYGINTRMQAKDMTPAEYYAKLYNARK